MDTFSFCTTFHQAGYDRYARNHIHYFDQALPEGINHYAYAQETKVDLEPKKIKILDFDKEVKGYKEYKEKYTDRKPVNKAYKTFEYEHVRFSHKVYAVLAHYEDRKDDSRYIGWIDGDVVPVKAIPLEFFHTLVKEGHFMSLLERGYKYAECGFMIWDTTLPETKEYFKRIRAQYDEGLMFEKYNDLGWHDSIIWDHEMRQMRDAGICKAYDLSIPAKNAKVKIDQTQVRKMHPFVKGILGEYMDHVKGRRKDVGYSKERVQIWG